MPTRNFFSPFWGFFFFKVFVKKIRKNEQKMFAAAQLATIAPTRWSGNRIFFGVAPARALECGGPNVPVVKLETGQVVREHVAGNQPQCEAHALAQAQSAQTPRQTETRTTTRYRSNQKQRNQRENWNFPPRFQILTHSLWYFSIEICHKICHKKYLPKMALLLERRLYMPFLYIF